MGYAGCMFSKNGDLPLALETFTAECKVVGITISTSKSVAMVPEEGEVPTLGQVQVSLGLVHKWGEIQNELMFFLKWYIFYLQILYMIF